MITVLFAILVGFIGFILVVQIVRVFLMWCRHEGVVPFFLPESVWARAQARSDAYNERLRK